MSGVVFRPPSVHTCAPGWEWTPVTPGSGIPGTHYGTPPTEDSHPRGTVWECDCGTRWISRGVLGWTVAWEREGRFARWRRIRKESRDA